MRRWNEDTTKPTKPSTEKESGECDRSPWGGVVRRYDVNPDHGNPVATDAYMYVMPVVKAS